MYLMILRKLRKSIPTSIEYTSDVCCFGFSFAINYFISIIRHKYMLNRSNSLSMFKIHFNIATKLEIAYFSTEFDCSKSPIRWNYISISWFHFAPCVGISTSFSQLSIINALFIVRRANAKLIVFQLIYWTLP